MARIPVDPNYSFPTFPRATAATDIFVKEDVQALAAAVSTHVHDGAGKGLLVGGPAAGSITNAMLGADVARANQLVNSGLEIWSRGTGPFPGNATYTADRWFMSFTVPSSLSVSRETVTVDTAFGSKTALKSVYTHSGGGSGYIQQQLKPADGSQLNSRVVTGSIRVNCNTSGAVRLQIAADGTGAPIAYSTFNGTTNAWVTLQATITVPPDATVVAVTVQLGDASLSSTAYVDNAMLVVGSQAANYVPMHPADDLARCLRYYERFDATNGQPFGLTQCYAATAAIGWLSFKCQKPVIPTMTLSPVTFFQVLNAAGAPIVATNVTAPLSSVQGAQVNVTVASGLVAGNAVLLAAASAQAASIYAESNP